MKPVWRCPQWSKAAPRSQFRRLHSNLGCELKKSHAPAYFLPPDKDHTSYKSASLAFFGGLAGKGRLECDSCFRPKKVSVAKER
jgi:hypothetical protein